VPLPEQQAKDSRLPWPSLRSERISDVHSQHSGSSEPPSERPSLDGGLMVVKASSKLFKQYFDEVKAAGKESREGWLTRDSYFYTELKWFFDHGCEWVKPVVGPGDFVLWDSRTIHYGAAPTSIKKRFAIYICYKPASLLTEEQREVKKVAFERGFCTTHDPTDFVLKNDQEADWNIPFPYGKPVVSEQGMKYIGLVPVCVTALSQCMVCLCCNRRFELPGLKWS